MLTVSSGPFQEALSQRCALRIWKVPSSPCYNFSDCDCCLSFISEIPEDPLVAEENYADVFDSCSEESKEQEEEAVFSEAGGEMRGRAALPYRANQQVPPCPGGNRCGCLQLTGQGLRKSKASLEPGNWGQGAQD